MTCSKRSPTAARTSRTSSKASCSRIPDGRGHRRPVEPRRTGGDRDRGAAVRLLERLSRRGELDRNRGIDRRPEALSGGGAGRILQFCRRFRVPSERRHHGRKGIVDQGIVDHHLVLGALIGAISWNIITWYYGIPSSSSHALIGGIVGAGVAKAGSWALIPAGLLKTVAFIFISPLMGFVIGSLLLLTISWLFVRSTPSRVDRLFRRLQLISSSLYSLGHGGNDAQKTVGIIWMLLIAGCKTDPKA